MNQTDPKAFDFSAVLFSAGLALGSFSLLAGEFTFWSRNQSSLGFPAWLGVSLSALLLVLGWWRGHASEAGFTRSATPQSLAALVHPPTIGWGLILLFISDWLTRGYNLLQGPSIRGEIVILGLALFALLKILHPATAPSGPIDHSVNTHQTAPLFWKILLLAAINLPLISFYSASKGSLIFSDDNPTFMFRLLQLKENFPAIPFYHPLWNGGIDARDFFATGALNIFLLLSPLIYSIDLSQYYNLIPTVLLFVIVPAAAWLAIRLAGQHSPAPEIGAILALTTSLVWYRWGLKYGTLGFCTATALVLLNLVLLSRMLQGNSSFRARHAALLIVSLSLMVMWSPTGLVLIPVLLLCIFKIRVILKNSSALTACTLILALNLPWMYGFWQVSNVSSFVAVGSSSASTTSNREGAPDSETVEAADQATQLQNPTPANTHFKRKQSAPSFALMLKEVREKAISTNPLLILFGIAGLFLLPAGYRLIFATTCAWLLLLGAYLAVAKPQLELDRMLVILTFVLTLPAALLLKELFTSPLQLAPKSTRWQAISRLYSLAPVIVALGFLGAGVFSVSGIAARRSVEQFSFADNEVNDLSQAIIKYSQGGRVLFSGFVLHELSGGHLAPLVFFTQTPLIASSHVHNMWRYKQIFPKQYLDQGESGIQAYLNDYNVGAVIAHERHWRDYFSKLPAQFSERWRGSKFVLFTRNDFNSNYFRSGSGTVLGQSSNAVEFKLDDSSAVLKFNYLPFLQVLDAATNNPVCELSAAPIANSDIQADTVTLIQLTNCPTNTNLILKSLSLPKRLKLF